MPSLIIAHKPYTEGCDLFSESHKTDSLTHSFYTWQTCRRKIVFVSDEEALNKADFSNYEIYRSTEAEVFLIETLCGLKSPLIGETEVFGQFKNWWKKLEDSKYKNQLNSRIQIIFSIVKKIREQCLCGIGSQSYGSLIRKQVEKINTNHINLIGAGQLTQEILPWLANRHQCTVWCRDIQKAVRDLENYPDVSIKLINEKVVFEGCVVVIAAPLPQFQIENWFANQKSLQNSVIFDFRRDSSVLKWTVKAKKIYHLNELTDEFMIERQHVQAQALQAKNDIQLWASNEQKRVQVRPFGWDDL